MEIFLLSMARKNLHQPNSSTTDGQHLLQTFSPKCGPCPAALTLLFLSLEPVVQAVRQSASHDLISVHDTKHYADDMLLFVYNISQSPSQLLSKMDNFRQISGHKMNQGKSALQPLNICTRLLATPPNITVVQNLKYLGISIYLLLNYKHCAI